MTPSLISFLEEHVGAELLGLLSRITPEVMINILDGQGIDKAVILAEATPKTCGVIPNEFTAGFCGTQDRLIPFGSINIESPVEPATQAEHCIRTLRCRGLKLLPSYSRYYPDDSRIQPVYEVAQSAGVPVMFHTGTSLFPGSRIRYANPLLLDDLAEDFPDLTIVMSHGGRPFWYAEAEWMLRRHPNTYIDVTGIPPKQLPEVFPKIDRLPDRFIFGTDWPMVASMGEQARQIRELPLKPQTIEAILWDNGARLLGL